MAEKNRICFPENDSDVRYLLGKKGEKNILVLALNPSTATALKHDGTSDNIDKIALVNGYDGWILFNLSPQRSPKPASLSASQEPISTAKNRALIKEWLLKEEWAIENVWLAWGDNITQRPYLISEACFLLNSFQNCRLKFWHIQITKKGHPYHPAKQALNRYIGPVENITLKSMKITVYLRSLNQIS
jgi:hypothetical protein